MRQCVNFATNSLGRKSLNMMGDYYFCVGEGFGNVRESLAFLLFISNSLFLMDLLIVNGKLVLGAFSWFLFQVTRI